MTLGVELGRKELSNGNREFGDLLASFLVEGYCVCHTVRRQTVRIGKRRLVVCQEDEESLRWSGFLSHLQKGASIHS